MKKVITLLLLLTTLTAVRAQGDVEYQAEIGGGVGLIAYEGDFNGSILKGQQPLGQVVFRRIFNPRSGVKASGTFGLLKGSSKDVVTYYPDYQTQTYDFSSKVIDVSMTYEYNLWPYGTGREYRGAQRLVPYLFGGMGFTYASTDNGKKPVAANLPLGVGIKYKMADRLNIGVEWAMHFTQSDELDGVKDPYTVKSSGIFKNTDCYSMLQLSITYSFMAKCRTCHNADE